MVLFVALFSRVENTVAFSKDTSDKSYASAVQEAQEQTISDDMLFEQTGGASWYGHRFHKKKTANGERYSKYKLTAAHRKLPFGSIVKVTNKTTGKSTFVRINDRGPFSRKRIIDLSYYAASTLGALGNPKVKIETLLPSKSFDSKEDGLDYLFAYSFDDKPSCAQASKFMLIKEFDNFDLAVEELHRLHNNSNGSKVRLLTPATDYKEFDEDEEFSGKYYIGFSKADFDRTFSQLFFL
jgi:rare lipoprotein A (peptidoglycan hydrolase)